MRPTERFPGSYKYAAEIEIGGLRKEAELLDRLHRYCANLPPDEPVPIHRFEVPLLAAYLSGMSMTAGSVSSVGRAIELGALVFNGHKLTLL